jgi:hypothetical protein
MAFLVERYSSSQRKAGANLSPTKEHNTKLAAKTMWPWLHKAILVVLRPPQMPKSLFFACFSTIELAFETTTPPKEVILLHAGALDVEKAH